VEKTIDLNCDIGESYGAWRMGDDDALLDLVSSANIACGFHAGDPATIDATVRAATQRGVAIGAHPSYPDLVGFGRRSMQISPADVESGVLYQLGALTAFVDSYGAKLRHVKPHGALYNDASRNEPLAKAVARAVARAGVPLTLVGLPGSALLAAGSEAGLKTAAEGFCDRAYEPDGSLRSRTLEGALISAPDRCARQAVELASGGRVQTLCIHGDTPGAASIALAVTAALREAGFTIAPPH
jgi:UPF0271 protein